MTAERLCAVLEDLGFGTHLDPNSFEWAFDGEARPVMEWLCDSLHSANVLNTQEIEEYNELVASGQVLQGELLDNAFTSMAAFEPEMGMSDQVFGETKSVQDIREGAAMMRAEAEALRATIRRMDEHMATLAKHNATLLQEKQRKKASTALTGKHMLDVAMQLSDRNHQMNKLLEGLGVAAEELLRLYQENGEDVYLSAKDVRPYTTQETECQRMLRLWWKKQFDEGPSRLVIKEGLSNCSWVSLDDVTNRFVKGDLESSYEKRVKELHRLRSIFQVSQRQWVEATVEVARKQAELAAARTQVANAHAHIRHDPQYLRRRQVDLETELYSLQAKEKQISQKMLPQVCRDLADLQDTYILQGDYDLKIMRQEYYLTQQKKFIAHMVSQQARHQFLRIAYETEAESHKNVVGLLQVSEAELRVLNDASLRRVERYARVVQSGSGRTRPHVSDQDKLLVDIRTLLGLAPTEWETQARYVDVERMKSQALKLQGELHTISIDLAAPLWQKKSTHMESLLGVVRRVHELLYASSGTAQPMLTPKAIVHTLVEMTKADNELSSLISAIGDQQTDWNHDLMHPVAAAMRGVFVSFFCSPDDLRRHRQELVELRDKLSKSRQQY